MSRLRMMRGTYLARGMGADAMKKKRQNMKRDGTQL